MVEDMKSTRRAVERQARSHVLTSRALKADKDKRDKRDKRDKQDKPRKKDEKFPG